MKKVFLRSAFVLTVFFAISGCSSDSGSDSNPAPIAKTKVTITRINVAQIPETNGSFDWDFSSAPDIYLKVYDETGHLSGTTGTLYDFYPTTSSQFSVTSTVYTTDLINTIIRVEVWDEDTTDSPSNGDDKIGEVPFYIHDYTVESNKYPTYAIKSSGETIVTIYMTWE